MIRYRMLTEAELAERDAKPTTPVKVKASAVKKRHYARKTDPPPRKIAGRHAAPRNTGKSRSSAKSRV